MNFATRLLVPALISVAAASAVASELSPEGPSASIANRADVMAQAVEAQRAGRISVGNVDVVASVEASTQSRQQVRAEAQAARRLGLMATGELQVQPTSAQIEQLRLVTRQAMQGGDLAQGGDARVVR